ARNFGERSQTGPVLQGNEDLYLHQFANRAEWLLLLQSCERKIRNPVDPGYRKRAGRGTAGSAYGHGNQRHPATAAAVGIDPSRRLPGDRGGVAGDSLAVICGWLLPFHCDYFGDLCRWRRALAGGISQQTSG